MKESILRSKSLNLGTKIINFCSRYSRTQNYVISNQLLRCGTSIGANVSEAGAAQTKKDFITKMAIASKEARETLYWLNLINSTGEFSQDCESLISDTEEIIRLLTATVKTAQKNEQSNH